MPLTQPTTIAGRCQQRGVRLTMGALSKAGRRAAEAFRARHKQDPGRVREGPYEVFAYVGSLDLLDEAIDWACKITGRWTEETVQPMQTLRPYQRSAVDDAKQHVVVALALPDDADPAARRILYSCPTGTGKGTIQLALASELRAEGHDVWIYTPSLEVLRGYLERSGVSAPTLDGCNPEQLAELGESIHVTTPVRARNRILDGTRGVPDVVIFDEVHHAISGNEVSGTLFAVAPLAAWVGYTATAFRGSPQGTRDLEADWPEIVDIMTIPEAVEGGWWALPTFEVIPLIDDDKIKVSGGEFQPKSAGRAVETRIQDLAQLVRTRLLNDITNATPRPTAVVVPSRDCGGLLVETLDNLQIPARMIRAETPARERALAYREAARNECALVTVQVICEGFDAPWLRRLIDARPTMSAVSFVQRLGRITRPGEVRPEAIFVCRNLERFAYLLGGLVPRRTLAMAQQAFPTPSKRAGRASVGLEALGRFKPIPIPLLDNVTGVMFLLYSVDQETGKTRNWGTLLDPLHDKTIVATCVHERNGDGTVKWGKWKAKKLPNDLTGFATSQNHQPVSVDQRKWWTKCARRVGLEPEPPRLARRQFQALPILSDLKETL